MPSLGHTAEGASKLGSYHGAQQISWVQSWVNIRRLQQHVHIRGSCGYTHEHAALVSGSSQAGLNLEICSCVMRSLLSGKSPSCKCEIMHNMHVLLSQCCLCSISMLWT